MKIYVTVDSRPAVIVAYHNDSSGRLCAICIGLGRCPVSVPLVECRLPKLSKRLQRRLNRFARKDTEAIQHDLAIED